MRIAHHRFIAFLVILAVITIALWRSEREARAFSIAFDVAAAVFILWNGRTMRRAATADIRAHAADNDAGRGALLLIAALLAAVVLVTVGIELRPEGQRSLAEIGPAVLTLVLAWAFGNTVYTLHYAHLYYTRGPDGDARGLDFPGRAEPHYWDFAYFAFTLGMTSAVSDVAVTSRRMRLVVMVHSMVAFFFNIGVLALAFGIVADAIR